MSKEGFTLIEILVVVSLVAIVGLILTNSLVQTLRGEGKTKIINQVKQNGQVVLDKLTNEIRQAKGVICINTNTDNTGNPNDTIVILNQDNSYTRFRFYPPQPGIGPISPSNGSFKKINFTTQDVIAFGIDTTQYNPTLCTNSTDFGQTSEIITNTDTFSGVSIDYHSPGGVKQPIFSKNTLSGFADTVTVKFAAFAGIEAGSAYEAIVKEGGILFTTTVQVRGGI